MDYVLKIFGGYTVADLIVVCAAIGAIVYGIKKAVVWTLGLADMVRSIYDMLRTIEANQEGTLALLRFRIRKECNRYLERGEVSAHELDELKDMYHAYHIMGGNGTTKRLYMEVQQLKLK